MKKKIVWFDARHLSGEEHLLPLVFNLRFEYLLIKPEQYKGLKCPKKMKIVCEMTSTEQLKDLADDVIVLSETSDVLREARKKGHKTAIFKTIFNQADLDSAWQEGSKEDFLVTKLTSDTNIPLELLIARLQPTNTSLLKVVSSAKEAEIAQGVMEIGSDGVVIETNEIKELIELDHIIAQEELGKMELVKGKVVEVEHIGMGYRACVDTVDIMQKNEGMVIGSTSAGGLLISSETHFLPYMELRPFRVNAGAVHSYVWAPDNHTNYLTELKAGKKVLCVDTQGNTREIVIGRIKTEKRPLLKIEVEVAGIRINTIVQDDWHIRIFGGNGEPVNASAIKVGDELLCFLSPGARHVGIKIDEFIEEK